MNFGIIYEHTDPTRWCTPLALANGFRSAGHNVDQYNLVNNAIVRLNPEVDYDMCIVMDWRGLRTSVSHPKRDKIMLIKECADCPQNLHLHLNSGLSQYDLLLCPAYDSVETLNDMGVNTIWWQHFADSSLQLLEDFADVPNPVRSTRGQGSSQILDTLSYIMPDKFINVNGWSGQEHHTFLSNGLITVQHSRHREATRRLPEAMLARSLVITDRLPAHTHIDDIFTENVDIVYYDSIQELIAKINFYLSEEGREARDIIAHNGWKNVRQNHTEKNRVESIIQQYNTWRTS